MENRYDRSKISGCVGILVIATSIVCTLWLSRADERGAMKEQTFKSQAVGRVLENIENAGKGYYELIFINQLKLF